LIHQKASNHQEMEKAIPVDNLIAAYVVNGKASKFLIEEINWYFEFYKNMTGLLQLFFLGSGELSFDNVNVYKD